MCCRIFFSRANERIFTLCTLAHQYLILSYLILIVVIRSRIIYHLGHGEAHHTLLFLAFSYTSVC